MLEFAGISIVVGMVMIVVGVGTIASSYGKHFAEYPTRALRYDVMSKGTQRVWKAGFWLVVIGHLIVLIGWALI
ncbi:MAG: hypothetical protein H7062_02535 [Candidatus Saccharimonas sp.]|nr:hypothetical protein [Planctomycetaceae bacterium]